MSLSEELRDRMAATALEDHGINLHVNPDGGYQVTDDEGKIIEPSAEERIKISEVIANEARLPGEDSDSEK